MFDHQDYIQAELRANDPERFLACLYLPEQIRHCAMTLYAFNAEIDRIPSLVSEPLPGEIRIQWWRDLLKSGGNVGSGPLAEALLQVCENHNLPRDVLDNSLEARIFDLYQDPMPDMGTYEGYLGETVSSFLQMISVANGLERSSELADACGHAGVAIGISRNLSLCSQSRRRGQIYFPISILREQGISRESWLGEDVTDQHAGIILKMIEHAKDHISKARDAIAKLPKDQRAVFLQLVFVDSLLAKIEQKPLDCLVKPVGLSPLKRQWLAFRGVSKL